ncbi:MAG TPA: alginate lyase family protein, partial [Pyrinomonadaceae bacterium]|nr:alginate lyase family protein [Pyrinomonadaceae bacterium]
LGHEVTFDREPKWNDLTQSHLWRYHLHYFNYVQELLVWGADKDRPAAYETFKRLARSWIEGNATITGDGWHSYTLSLRIVNWIHACAFFREELQADPDTRELLLGSIFGQAQILFRDLELDVRGNHLIENLRALIWAGLAFDGKEPRRWLEVGLRLLAVEVGEQVLDDGGHFERSPGYHLVVFKDLLEIALWLRRNDYAARQWLDNALRLMHQYLWTILAPDGNVPLLKDTAWDAAPKPYDLLAAAAVYFEEPAYKYAEQFGLYPWLLFGGGGWNKFKDWRLNDSSRESTALPASGHYTMRDERRGNHLILDAGKPCPDYLPAHAHADLLTYELSVKGQRVVVDSGIYEYQAGAWRDFFRSTRAHNTVAVGGENQSEVWSSFRVGRRARPGPVQWQSNEDYVLVQAEHDGYARLKVPVIHQRTIVGRTEQFWLIVDQLWGTGVTSFASYVHLHPDFSFTAAAAKTWQIQQTRAPLWLKTFGVGEPSIVTGETEPERQGWYSERFGELRPRSVLTLRYQGSLPICCGYVIALEPPAELQVNPAASGHEVNLNLGGRSYRVSLKRSQPPKFE